MSAFEADRFNRSRTSPRQKKLLAFNHPLCEPRFLASLGMTGLHPGASHQRLTTASKKRLQYFAATTSQQASPHFHLMVQLGVVEHRQYRVDRTCLWVVRAVHQAFQPGVNHGASAHSAWFDCSKQLAVSQTMIAEGGTGFPQSNDLRVRSGIGIGQVPVPTAADELSGGDDNGSHGHLPGFQRALRGAKGFFHPEFVGSSC
jgi:hypothetical protein